MMAFSLSVSELGVLQLLNFLLYLDCHKICNFQKVDNCKRLKLNSILLAKQTLADKIGVLQPYDFVKFIIFPECQH